MRGHLEGSHFEEAKAASRGVWGVEFVDAELGAVGVASYIDE